MIVGLLPNTGRCFDRLSVPYPKSVAMTSTPLYFLGIDGGGTKCRARLRDARGALLGEGLGGPANIRLGLDLAWGSILDAADGALAQAGLDRDALDQTHAGLGLAGRDQ
ncbi:MAG: BadF/BadG/BcrA/BcrD ATPase family protein [Azospirillaceae bacterium]|nr:BadF/BadG/BcrA/BcrD ATPase family protein [Azospirillaceae bacterium]